MKKKLTFRTRPVTIKATTYRNNGTLAVMLTRKNGDSDVITVNLNSPMQSDSMAFLDSNNYPDIEKWIQKNHLGVSMGYKQQSGFCQYPLYTIFPDAL